MTREQVTREQVTAGGVPFRAFGRGEPVTVFAHGLGGGIDGTRPFASGVPGTRVFLEFRGHHAGPVPPTPWSYADLAREVEVVADQVGATRAVGVSMGAAALTALVARRPERFERLVLALPAVLDRPRSGDSVTRSQRFGEALDSGDRDAVIALLTEETGSPAYELVGQWAPGEADRLLALRPGIVTAFREMARAAALPDRAALAAVSASVLVIAQEGDDVHPVDVAREVAAAFPRARLEVVPRGGLVWSHRDTLRRFVSEFLGR